MTPSFDQIHEDDQLLDALGARDKVRGDELTGLLSAWTMQIDNPTALPRAGRHARHSRALRIGLTTTVVLGTLSVGGVAAAVTGTKLPVLHQLGQVTQGFWGEPAAPAVVAPPPSSAAPLSTDPSTPWSIDPTHTTGTSRDQATRVPSLVPSTTRAHLPGAPVIALRPRVSPATSSSSTSTPTATSTSPSPTKSSGTPTGSGSPTPSGSPTSTGSPTRTGGPVMGPVSPSPSGGSTSSSTSDPTATSRVTPSSSSSNTPSATSSSGTSTAGSSAASRVPTTSR